MKKTKVQLLKASMTKDFIEEIKLFLPIKHDKEASKLILVRPFNINNDKKILEKNGYTCNIDLERSPTGRRTINIHKGTKGAKIVKERNSDDYIVSLL